jgi:hypothetical protein
VEQQEVRAELELPADARLWIFRERDTDRTAARAAAVTEQQQCRHVTIRHRRKRYHRDDYNNIDNAGRQNSCTIRACRLQLLICRYTTGGQLRRLLFGIHLLHRRLSATEFKARRHHIGDIGYLLSLWDLPLFRCHRLSSV